MYQTSLSAFIRTKPTRPVLACRRPHHCTADVERENQALQPVISTQDEIAAVFCFPQKDVEDDSLYHDIESGTANEKPPVGADSNDKVIEDNVSQPLYAVKLHMDTWGLHVAVTISLHPTTQTTLQTSVASQA